MNADKYYIELVGGSQFTCTATSAADAVGKLWINTLAYPAMVYSVHRGRRSEAELIRFADVCSRAGDDAYEAMLTNRILSGKLDPLRTAELENRLSEFRQKRKTIVELKQKIAMQAAEKNN